VRCFLAAMSGEVSGGCYHQLPKPPWLVNGEIWGLHIKALRVLYVAGYLCILLELSVHLLLNLYCYINTAVQLISVVPSLQCHAVAIILY